MKAVYVNRLLKLAVFLDKLPKAKFDFSTITSLGQKPMMEALKAGRHRCGTTACAIGWMPAIFPRQVCWVGEDRPYGDLNVGLRSAGAARRVGKARNFAVAQRFFGISYEEALHLFNPGDISLRYDATPKQVAKHIRRFVRERQREKAAA